MRVLIAGGGTGGHLYPGIALAEAITAAGGEVLFAGTKRGLETTLVPKAGFRLELLDVSGLKRAGGKAMLVGLLRVPRALLQSRRILRAFRPDVVVGVGGYASGPMVLAAALSGYPTAIQEQNSRPGFTNRVLGRFARRVFVAFEEAGPFFPRRKLRLTGNPVRRRFLEATADASAAAPARGPAPASAPAGEPTLLIVGGSQGSHAVNELASQAVQILRARGRRLRAVHQTGPAEEASVQLAYDALGLGAAVEVRAYIDDMPAALAAATLVIGRAGALTLAELAIVGRPSVLIPLPTAADDHQTSNARELERAGAAVVLPQHGTSGAQLADAVEGVLFDPARLAAMTAAAARLGRPRATEEIVEELASLARRRGARGRGQQTPGP